MDLNLKGKRVLVTGSSTGIGEGIARFLAKEGCIVAIHGRNNDRINQVADEIRADGGQAVTVLGEMNDDDSVKQVALGALEALGGVDILVANAGGRVKKGNTPWDTTTPADFMSTFQINVASAVRLVHELVPGMKEQHWGRVILISSIASVNPMPDLVPDYAACKAALVTTGLSLAKWLRNTGITVNTISPGVILSDGVRNFFLSMADKKGWPKDDWPALEKQAVKELFQIPVGRIGTPQDIAAMVALISSDLGGFIHGSNIRMDGGSVGVTN